MRYALRSFLFRGKDHRIDRREVLALLGGSWRRVPLQQAPLVRSTSTKRYCVLTCVQYAPHPTPVRSRRLTRRFPRESHRLTRWVHSKSCLHGPIILPILLLLRSAAAGSPSIKTHPLNLERKGSALQQLERARSFAAAVSHSQFQPDSQNALVVPLPLITGVTLLRYSLVYVLYHSGGRAESPTRMSNRGQFTRIQHSGTGAWRISATLLSLVHGWHQSFLVNPRPLECESSHGSSQSAKTDTIEQRKTVPMVWKRFLKLAVALECR